MQSNPIKAARVESSDLTMVQMPQTVPECHAVIALLLEHWRRLTASGVTDLLSSVLTDYVDPAYAEVRVHGVPKAATPAIGARDVSCEVSVAS